MWTDAILAYLHFLAIIAIFVVLARELILLRGSAASLDIGALAATDRGFGIVAVIVLLTGAARAVYGIKGWAFYAHNPAFHIKMGLFVLIALLSIVPTVRFLRWNKAQRLDPAFRVPEDERRRTRILVHVELTLLALMPLAAVVMARGLL